MIAAPSRLAGGDHGLPGEGFAGTPILDLFGCQTNCNATTDADPQAANHDPAAKTLAATDIRTESRLLGHCNNGEINR